MGRKLPKKHGYKKDSQVSGRNTKFPAFIGKFPECKDYPADMKIEDRSECQLCAPLGVDKK